MKFSKLKMDEKLSVHGLININDEEISGILEYEDNFITLTFVKLKQHLESDPDFADVEFLSSHGERIFLKNGSLINVLANSRGLHTYYISYEYLFLLKPNKNNFELNNENFKNEKFNQVYLNYPQFKKVLNNNPHTYLYDKEVDYITRIENNSKSKLSTEFTYKENRIKVSDHLEGFQGINDELSLSVDYNAYLKLYTEQLISFDDVVDLTFKLRNLLSFVLEQKIKLKEFYIKNENYHFKVFWSKEIDIIESKSKRNLEYIKTYFNDNFTDIVQGYFKHTKELEDIFEIYVNNMYVQHYYLDSYLLSQIAILEGLHTRFIDDDKNTRLKPRLEDLFKSLDKNKFNKVLRESGINIEKVDIKVLAKYLRDFRNYHSHYYVKKDKKIYINTANLIYLLRIIAKEFIYKHIGVNESFILSKPEQYEFKELPIDKLGK